MTTCPASSRSDPRHVRLRRWCFVAAAAVSCAAIAADDPELDALKLQGEPEKKGAPAATRFFVEAALGRAELRAGASDTISRLTLDLRHQSKLGTNWRWVFSDRLDHLDPRSPGDDAAINTLREAYLGWQDDAAEWALELGRINLRNGPAYGYNPTDFFRDGSQRALTTVDPIALRDNRMGTVVLRAQRLWPSGSASAVIAPKLSDSGPSGKGASLDLGATNGSNRLLLALGQQLPGGISAQALAFKPSGSPWQWGVNATALIGDAVVVHGEASGGREPSLAARAFATPRAGEVRAERVAAGFTVTPPGGWSLTAEVQYNGFAMDPRQWAFATVGGVPRLTTYVLAADQRQDLAARKAVLLYVSKKDIGVRNLTLTAFVRANVDDDSRLAWLQLRYALPSVELGLQWQQFQGSALTEFGVIPYRQSVQALLTYRF